SLHKIGIGGTVRAQPHDGVEAICSKSQRLPPRQDFAIALQRHVKDASLKSRSEARIKGTIAVQAKDAGPRLSRVLGKGAADNNPSIAHHGQRENPGVGGKAGIEGGVQSAIGVKTDQERATGEKVECIRKDTTNENFPI